MKSLRSAACIVFTASLSSSPLIASTALSIEEALKKGFIQLIIKGKGGYTGDVIEMKIKNTCTQNLDLKIEAGRRLDSKDNSQQDILVTKPEEIFVSSKQLKTVNVFGMCCQAHNSSPTEKSFYTVGHMADSNLIKLATFIDKNKYYTNSTAQQAVWTVSDNESLGSIYDGDKDTQNKIRNFVAKITGKKIPEYNIDYVKESDRDVMGKASKIEGVFDYTLPENSHVSLAIYDSEGHLVQVLFDNIAHNKGYYKLYYTFRTRNIPQGTYYARMKMDGQVQKEMKIDF